jgi:ion channel-forming bestrophin family protein
LEASHDPVRVGRGGDGIPHDDPDQGTAFADGAVRHCHRALHGVSDQRSLCALVGSANPLGRAHQCVAQPGQDHTQPDQGGPEGSETRHNIILRQIAFAHSMRCQLRRQSPYEDIARIAGTDVADMAVARLNPANALLEDISGNYADALAEGRITEIQQATVERVLIDIANAQGGMERIKNTPLPNGFRFFPNLFTRVFCVLLPIALVESLGLATPIGSTLIGLVFLAVLSIGEDLTDPFANSVHDVPLTAMCRTIEIDLLQTAGLPAPEPLTPDHGVLW